MEEALAACGNLNSEGISVSLDSLGESVTSAAQAHASAAVYQHLLQEIDRRKLDANVSVKLTQMGMDFDPELAEVLVSQMVAQAAATGSFVRIDMEGSQHTEATVAMTERLHARPGFHGRVGTVLQAYLYRTEADAERLLGQGIRIRLCKGAYKEPPDLAFPSKSDVDANYVCLMKRLASPREDGATVFCGMATHDEAIINAMCALVESGAIEKQAFEFQMLYGIRRDLQRRLVSQGYGVRVYVPFGTEWYPYFMRRLAERPANIFFLAKNLLKT